MQAICHDFFCVQLFEVKNS